MILLSSHLPLESPWPLDRKCFIFSRSIGNDVIHIEWFQQPHNNGMVFNVWLLNGGIKEKRARWYPKSDLGESKGYNFWVILWNINNPQKISERCDHLCPRRPWGPFLCQLWERLCVAVPYRKQTFFRLSQNWLFHGYQVFKASSVHFLSLNTIWRSYPRIHACKCDDLQALNSNRT